MKKIYLVCPNCLKVEDTATESQWVEEHVEYSVYHYRRKNGKVDLSLMYGDEECTTRHTECEFKVENLTPEDFEVVFEDGEIVEVGNYWKGNKEKFEKIKKTSNN